MWNEGLSARSKFHGRGNVAFFSGTLTLTLSLRGGRDWSMDGGLHIVFFWPLRAIGWAGNLTSFYRYRATVPCRMRKCTRARPSIRIDHTKPTNRGYAYPRIERLDQETPLTKGSPGPEDRDRTGYL